MVVNSESKVVVLSSGVMKRAALTIISLFLLQTMLRTCVHVVARIVCETDCNRYTGILN